MTGQLSAKLKFIPEWRENDCTLRSKWSLRGRNGEIDEDGSSFTNNMFDATVACEMVRLDLLDQGMAPGTKREHEKSEFVAHSRHASSSSACTSNLNRKDPSDMDVARPPVAGKEA